MANYTMELREILYSLMENPSPENCLGDENVDKVIDSTWDKFFNFDFPTWATDNAKSDICKHILEDYYFREIGYSTPGRFKSAVRQKIRDIMPYYIEMYNTTVSKLNYDILSPMRYKRTVTETSKTTGKTETVTSNDNTSTDSAKGYDSNSGFLERTRNVVNGSGKITQTPDTTDSRELNEEFSGKSSNTSYASLIKEERENIINILQMISEEMECLFMGVW